MIVTTILGNKETYKDDKKIIAVKFEWFELGKKRIKKIAEDGTELGITVSDKLHQGDILGQTQDRAYMVQVLPTHLIKIKVYSMEEMGRLGFELGNRHLSLEIRENEVRVPFDKPTFEYLKKLGFHVEDVEESFHDPIECKAHGHTHHHV